MIVWSTCRTCHGLLHVTDGCDTHPLCEPQPAIKACHPPRLLAAALKYASWDWPVFPLKPQSKTPATTHGFHDATDDPARIRAWWQRHPNCNIGTPTGLSFDVIDIDLPDGPESYAQMLEDELIPDIHGQVDTASGGRHLYIEPTGDGCTTRLRPGIDYRGVGGFIVVPPSVLGESSWRWVTYPSPRIVGGRQ